MKTDMGQEEERNNIMQTRQHQCHGANHPQSSAPRGRDCGRVFIAPGDRKRREVDRSVRRADCVPVFPLWLLNERIYSAHL